LVDGQDRVGADGCLGGPVEPHDGPTEDEHNDHQRDQNSAAATASSRRLEGYGWHVAGEM
jgi:hypothetical protein